MRKIFSLILIFLVFLKISSQNNNALILDSVEKNDLRQSFSIGWSNPITSTLSLSDEKPRERIGILVDYQLFVSKNNFYRFHTKFSANNQNNIFSPTTTIQSLVCNYSFTAVVLVVGGGSNGGSNGGGRCGGGRRCRRRRSVCWFSVKAKLVPFVPTISASPNIGLPAACSRA